jgi:hypothetical protein
MLAVLTNHERRRLAPASDGRHPHLRKERPKPSEGFVHKSSKMRPKYKGRPRRRGAAPMP